MSDYTFIGQSVSPEFTYPSPQINRKLAFIIIPEFDAASPKAGIARDPRGAPGEYLARFVFMAPGRDVFFTNFAILDDSGDSQISIGPSSLKVSYIGPLIAAADVLQFELLPNTAGRLARARIKVNAQSFGDAEYKAYNVLAPLLSRISFENDSAIDIAAYDIYETATDVRAMKLMAAGAVRPLNLNDLNSANNEVPSEIIALFSTYREGLNTMNVFYRFLCFFKVVEGVLQLRPQRNRKAKADGRKPSVEFEERFPNSLANLQVEDDEKDFFKPYLGKTFGAVRDDLRQLMRNAVAHLNPTTSPFLTDNIADTGRCQTVTPVVKMIARRMIENEIAEIRKRQAGAEVQEDSEKTAS